MKYKFVSLVADDKGNTIEESHPSFESAFRSMYKHVKDLLPTGLTTQVLETAMWIEFHQVPTYWPDALGVAYEAGLMKDGKLVD